MKNAALVVVSLAGVAGVVYGAPHALWWFIQATGRYSMAWAVGFLTFWLYGGLWAGTWVHAWAIERLLSRTPAAQAQQANRA